MLEKLARPAFVAVAVLALLATAAACGGDDDEDEPNGGTPADGNGGPREFDVSMGDNFFEPNEFAVSDGSDVTFNVTNDGTALHNMRVAGADNEFNTDDDAVSEEDLLSPGDSTVLSWTAPEEPGEYKLQCDIHPQDMTGTITVE